MNLDFLEIQEDRINMKKLIGNDWDEILAPAFDSEQYQKLHDFLKSEYQTKQIFPDMYHNPGQATGMSFSVNAGVALPPSLKNIYKELYDDVGAIPVNHGYLKKWADQGVLLLNAVLTVPYGNANGHQGKGWEIVTDAAIKALSDRGKVVFILWGRFAQNKIPLIDEEKNVIIKSAHPSPFSADRGFFGSRPFSRCNDALTKFGESPIDWQLPQEVSQSDMA